jgi:hypothetical protein
LPVRTALAPGLVSVTAGAALSFVTVTLAEAAVERPAASLAVAVIT